MVQKCFVYFFAYKTIIFNPNIREITNFAVLKSLNTRKRGLNDDIDCLELLREVLGYSK